MASPAVYSSTLTTPESARLMEKPPGRSVYEHNSRRVKPKLALVVAKENARTTLTGALVTTMGQPMEVIKTHASANRTDTLGEAVGKTWGRAGVRGFYQGLIPWAWIEAFTKGAILVLTSTEVEYYAKTSGLGKEVASVLGGIVGGASQAYLTMGVTTGMKTVEVTRKKAPKNGGRTPRTPGIMEVFLQILRTKGIRGVNRVVNAVALRQITGWSSRIGISRVAEGQIKSFSGKSSEEKLAPTEKIVASIIGGALSCWNQPFEVARVEMQSLKADPSRPQ